MSISSSDSLSLSTLFILLIHFQLRFVKFIVLRVSNIPDILDEVDAIAKPCATVGAIG